MFASSSLIKAYALSHWAHCLIPFTSFADTSAGKAVLGELHELKNKLLEAQKSYEDLSKKKAEEMRQALDAQKRLLDQRLKNMERQRDQAQETMDRKMKRLQREMEEREANLKKLEKESTKSEKQNAELKKKLRKLEKQQDAWKARSSDKGKSSSGTSKIVGSWSGSKSSGGSIQCSFTLSGTTLRGSGVSVTNNGQRSSFSVGSGSSYSDGSIRFIVDYGKSGTSNEEFSGRLSECWMGRSLRPWVIHTATLTLTCIEIPKGNGYHGTETYLLPVRFPVPEDSSRSQATMSWLSNTCILCPVID